MCRTSVKKVQGWLERASPGFLLACVLLALPGCGNQMDNQPRKEEHEQSTFFEDGQSARHLVPGTVPRGYLRNDSLLFTGFEEGGEAQDGEESGSVPSAGGQSGSAQTGQDEQTDEENQETGETGQIGQGGGTDVPGEETQGQQQAPANVFPFPVNEEVLRRGQVRFNVFCAPCHSRVGDGDGMIVRRGYSQPPSLHSERLREAPVGHFYDVITNGWGAMPPYDAQIPVYDRWAIVAYIRALQLSQNAALEDVPEEEREQLENGDQSP